MMQASSINYRHLNLTKNIVFILLQHDINLLNASMFYCITFSGPIPMISK